MIVKTFTRKENTEVVKERLINSMSKSDTLKERELNIHNIIDQGEAIDIIKH